MNERSTTILLIMTYIYIYVYCVCIYIYIYMAKCSLVSSTNTLDCNPTNTMFTWQNRYCLRLNVVVPASNRRHESWSSILKDLSTKPAGLLLNFWNRKDPKSKKKEMFPRVGHNHPIIIPLSHEWFLWIGSIPSFVPMFPSNSWWFYSLTVFFPLSSHYQLKLNPIFPNKSPIAGFLQYICVPKKDAVIFPGQITKSQVKF